MASTMCFTSVRKSTIFMGVILNRHQRWFSIFQGRLQAVTELGKGFGAFCLIFALGTIRKYIFLIRWPGWVSSYQYLYFVKLTGNGVVLGVVGILEIVQIKRFKFIQIFTSDQAIQLQALPTGTR